MDSWNKNAAIKANQFVKDLGIDRRGLVEEDLIGYNVPHLDGIWLRGPYLHNGSLPTLRDLLKPPAERPKLFYRGCDVYDPVNVGFKDCPEGKRIDPPYDVSRKGNGNSGHVFGTELPASDIDALIEYMKTL